MPCHQVGVEKMPQYKRDTRVRRARTYSLRLKSLEADVIVYAFILLHYILPGIEVTLYLSHAMPLVIIILVIVIIICFKYGLALSCDTLVTLVVLFTHRSGRDRYWNGSIYAAELASQKRTTRVTPIRGYRNERLVLYQYFLLNHMTM